MFTYHEFFVLDITAKRFLLPFPIAGRDDIEITVEFGESADLEGHWACNVWARIGKSAVRGYIYSFAAPVCDDAVNSVVEPLREDPAFHKAVNRYVAYMTRNGAER